jgi:muramoyltetrapeptide carboxypeptidase LdcA involved in peptidoglycan recycling
MKDRAPTHQYDLVAWRVDRLMAAGFSKHEALVLVRSGGVDLHAVLELIDRGCPPSLAARITASLDCDLPRSA